MNCCKRANSALARPVPTPIGTAFLRNYAPVTCAPILGASHSRRGLADLRRPTPLVPRVEALELRRRRDPTVALYPVPKLRALFKPSGRRHHCRDRFLPRRHPRQFHPRRPEGPSSSFARAAGSPPWTLCLHFTATRAKEPVLEPSSFLLLLCWPRHAFRGHDLDALAHPRRLLSS